MGWHLFILHSTPKIIQQILTSTYILEIIIDFFIQQFGRQMKYSFRFSVDIFILAIDTSIRAYRIASKCE